MMQFDRHVVFELGTLAHGVTPRPSWNRATGELSFNGTVLKRVAAGRSTAVAALLDELEELGWPERVGLPPGWSETNMHTNLRSLNAGLSGLRFHGDGHGTGVTWGFTE